MRETYEIRVDDSVYVLDKAFVDMMRSKRSFLWTRVVITNEMLVYRDWETDRKSTRLNSSHSAKSRMPSSA